MLKILLFLLIPYTLCLSSSSVCYNFVCKEQIENKTGCIVKDGSNYYLESCKSDWF